MNHTTRKELEALAADFHRQGDNAVRDRPNAPGTVHVEAQAYWHAAVRVRALLAKRADDDHTMRSSASPGCGHPTCEAGDYMGLCIDRD